MTATVGMGITTAYLVIKTKRQKVRVKTLESNKREYYKFLENIPNRIIRYDNKTKKAYTSELSGYYLNARDEHSIKVPLTYFYNQSDPDYERNVRDVLISRRNSAAHLNFQDANGMKRRIKVEWVPEFGHAGELISIFTIGQDVTDSIERQQLIRTPGYFDHLTHLPNRSFLLKQINHIIHSTDGIVQPAFALLVLDIDEFKEVNNLLGYATSDLLICEVVSRLNTVLRHTDMLARLCGDEFAILLPQIQSKAELTPILGEIMALFTWPFQMFAQELSITISIGAVLYPCDAQKADHVLSYANTAMHSAKELGRSNIQFYTEDMTKRSMARTVLDAALRKAVVQNELMLYYQPQFDLASRGLLGAEALVRWQHPTLGLLSPDRFIPLAEETGQINEIGTWVLDAAFRAAFAWNRLSNTPIKIAVNLSTRQFFRNDIVMTVRTLMAVTGCLPAWIKLEITESLLLDKSADILNKLYMLSDLGFDFYR